MYSGTECRVSRRVSRRAQSAERSLKSTECRLQTAERKTSPKLQTAECGTQSLQSAERSLKSAESRAQSEECRLQTAERKTAPRLQTAECRLWPRGLYKVQTAKTVQSAETVQGAFDFAYVYYVYDTCVYYDNCHSWSVYI